MYTLKSITKHNIETCVSLSFSELVDMDYDDEINLLKPVNRGEITFPAKRDFRKIGRGNPLLARRRFRTMEEVDRRLSEIGDENFK
jgi:hypothetical protein